MKQLRASGRHASTLKYDILTALGSHGCAAGKHRQRLVLRFVTLIVARYNWQADELAVGQREIAALWAVDELTVKREVSALRSLGWLVQRRAAARGRVAVHGLGLAEIFEATRPDWLRVGPDLNERLSGTSQNGIQSYVKVIHFPGLARVEGSTLWDRMLAVLATEDSALCAAWFAMLEAQPAEADRLVLRAPSRFHAAYVTTHYLSRLAALARSDGTGISSVEITA